MSNSIFKNKAVVKTVSGVRYTDISNKKNKTTTNNEPVIDGYKKFGDVIISSDTLKSIMELSMINFMNSNSKSLYIKTVIGLINLNIFETKLEDISYPKNIKHDFDKNIFIEKDSDLDNTIDRLSRKYHLSRKDLLHFSEVVGDHMIHTCNEKLINQRILQYRACNMQ